MNVCERRGDQDMKQWNQKDWSTYDQRSKYRLNQPFLIVELTRTVPFFEQKYIRYHLLNLPNYKIGQIEIMGVIRQMDTDRNKYYRIQVDDGTGLIEVYLKKQDYKPDISRRNVIDSLYKKQALAMDPNAYKTTQIPKSFPRRRPEFQYGPQVTLQQMAVLENKWWNVTKQGSLGKNFEVSDYIWCQGFPTLDREQFIQRKGKIEFNDLRDCRLTFFANKATVLPEDEYLKQFFTWMENFQSKRYNR